MTGTTRPYDPTAEQKARAQLSTEPGLSVLADARSEVLLDAYASLTHRIHEIGERQWSPAARDEASTNLRAQRDLIRAELLTRMQPPPALPSARSLDLAVVALESAAQSCQSGASLTGRGVDPLAREYLVAAAEVEALS